MRRWGKKTSRAIESKCKCIYYILFVRVAHSARSCQAVPFWEPGGRAWAVGSGARDELLEIQVGGRAWGAARLQASQLMHVGATSNPLSLRPGETQTSRAQRVWRFALYSPDESCECMVPIALRTGSGTCQAVHRREPGHPVLGFLF